MQGKDFLSPEEQRALFDARGISFSESSERDAAKIQEIGYYKLKEFAFPFSVSDNPDEPQYRNLDFQSLLVRYYQDKNLRIFILHAVEDIEVHLGNSVATILGKRYGAFGYLNFSNWCDRDIKKFQIEKKQFYFKKDLLKAVQKSRSHYVNLSANKNDEGFPTVWLMINVLMFGNVINLIDIMSLNNKRALARIYGCTPDELVSWLKCLLFVRNTCAHDSNLIDLNLRTQPMVPRRYESKILETESGYSNGLAIVLLIIKTLMNTVNSKYKFGNIYDSLYRIIDHEGTRATSIGFASIHSIDVFKPYKKRKKHKP